MADLLSEETSANSLHIEQYLGLWMIEPHAFQKQVDFVNGPNFGQHLQQMNGHEVKTAPTIRYYVPTAMLKHDKSPSGLTCLEQLSNKMPRHAVQGLKQAGLQSAASSGLIAEFVVSGTMTKNGSSMSEAGSTRLLVRAVNDALQNDAIVGAMFTVETPGGQAFGTKELADAVWEFSQVKASVTFIDDMMASAGVFAFSQTKKIFANSPAAFVGSVGTLMKLVDSSEAASKEGYKVMVIGTGELKGFGTPGTPLSDGGVEMWKNLVGAMQTEFDAAYQRARKPTAEQFAKIKTAGLFPASEAVGLGLIDGIRSKEAALAELRAMVPSNKKGRKMSQETEGNAPQAASLAELKQACPGASADFLIAAIDGELSAKAASSKWCASLSADNGKLELANTELTAKVAQLTEEIATLKAGHEKAVTELKAEHAVALAKAGGQKPAAGTFQPLPEGGTQTVVEGSVSAVEQWNEGVKELMAAGKTKQVATQTLARQNPDLHRAYLAAVNSRS